MTEFIASWELFGDTYLAGWLVALLLSLVGVYVVARDQIFLGAAVSQASTLGTAVAIWIQGVTASHALQSDVLTFGLAVAASVVTVLVTGRPARAASESSEAVTGWVFLVGGSLPVLLLAHSPHGLEEVHRLLFSSILGASRADVWLFAGMLTLAIVGLVAARSRLVLLAIDPEMAAAVGMRLRPWTLAMACALGAAVGISIHSAGMLYTFGCLVLPALVARNLCREIAPMFWVSPLVALAASGSAFVLAHRFDVPPAQLTIAMLCAVLGVAWAVRALRRRSGVPSLS